MSICLLPANNAREREYSSVLVERMPKRANCCMATRKARTCNNAMEPSTNSNGGRWVMRVCVCFFSVFF